MFIGPPLERVAITVGSGAYDGTADSVILKFKNGDGETCLTEGKALITITCPFNERNAFYEQLYETR